MKVGDLINALDRWFPFDGAGAWDRVGLQVGGVERPATSVGVCHEVTSAVLDQARRDGIDVLIAYHPLLFAPTTVFTEGEDPSGRALSLAEAGISLIVVHTALDVAHPGTADAFLESIGLAASGTFAPVDEDGGADIGRIAELPAPLDLGTLSETVAAATGSATRFNMDPRTQIAKVGVVPGSGGEFVDDAIGIVDCYVTGDVTHHGANRARSMGLAVIDAGHAPSERAGVQSLYAHTVELVPDATMLTDDAHPWRA